MKDVEGEERREQLEIALLLHAVHEHYGYDFRDYAPASLHRRIQSMVASERLTRVTELLDRLLHDPACMQRFLLALSINTTAMFRDPAFWQAFRQRVVPILADLPHVRIWHAGCSTGEEVYSTLIVLRESALSEKTRIYATDMNEAVLSKAKAGIFPLKAMQEYTENYLQAGGTRSFSEYYTANHEEAIFGGTRKENVVWAQHNLVTDGSFNEFHAIFCRNVMIYFKAKLQERVTDLLFGSLAPGGMLCLGTKESLRFSSRSDSFEEILPGLRIYRRLK